MRIDNGDGEKVFLRGADSLTMRLFGLASKNWGGASSCVIFMTTFILILLMGIEMFQKEVMAKESYEFTYGAPSFTADSQNLVFDRCPQSGECRIHVLDLKTNTLKYYRPLAGQIWFAGKFSPSGNQIVFVSIPLLSKKSSESADNRDYANAQIAIMDADGRNVRMLTSGLGYKMAPNFSWSGKKIIYGQGELRKPGSKTLYAKMDAFEMDLETGVIRQLTDFAFFQMGRPSYLPGDSSFVVAANGPTKVPGISDIETLWKYQREMSQKNNESWVHRFTVQGPAQPLSPLFTNPFYYANKVTTDKAGNLYFKAQPSKKEEFRIYRNSIEGQLDSWERKPHLQTRFAEVSPDGRYWLEISKPGLADDLNGIFMLDLSNGVWHEVSAVGQAQPI